MTGKPANPSTRLSRREALKSAAAATSAVALAGCGRGLGGSSSSSGSSLQMMFWGEGDQTKPIVDAINTWQKNGKTKVSAQYGPLNGYFDKLATRVAGGTPPDIFQLYLPYLTDYIDRGVVMPLDKYADQLGLQNIPPSILPTIKSGGHYYFALMGAATQPAIVYDSDLLKKYSLRPATDDWTIHDFQQTMLKVHTASKGKLWGISDGGGSSVQLESYMRAFNTPLFDSSGQLAFTPDQFSEWLQFWDTMRKNGSCPPMKVTAGATGFPQDPLVKGKAAYTLTATSRGYPTIQALSHDHLGLLQFPRATATSKPGTNIIPNGYFAISKKSKNPDKAVALLKYLASSTQAIKTMGLTRGVPLSKAQQDAVKGQLSGPDKEVFDNYLKAASENLADLQLYPPGSSDLMTNSLSTANQNVGFGKATVTQATQQFFADAKKALK